MPYKFFSNSKNAWQAMYGSIESARESVYLEMYILEDDIDGFDFIKLLKEKAQSGVKVKIILDYFGSFSLSQTLIAGLKEAGAEVFFFSYFFHRTHRKILIADENLAFIGGVNFNRSALFWDDLVMQVEGRLVSSIIQSFARVYTECGGKDRSILFLGRRKIILNKTRAWLVEHFPVSKKPRLKIIYRKYLSGARKSIILVTPYFLPKRWLIKIIREAALRGVKVEVQVPKLTNYFILDRAAYFFMFKLSKLGVNFYLQSKMNHAKVMIIDAKEGMVGSNNLDFLSFELNSEVGIFLKDEGTVGKLVEIVDEWKKDAVLFDFSVYKPKFFDYIFSPIFSVFTRIF